MLLTKEILPDRETNIAIVENYCKEKTCVSIRKYPGYYLPFRYFYLRGMQHGASITGSNGEKDHYFNGLKQ